MSKKDERIQRQLEKMAKRRDKDLRLSQGITIADKFIRISSTPDIKKKVSATLPDGYKNYYFSWCKTHSDTSGIWTWGEHRQWTQEEESQQINPTLNGYNNCSWNEIEEHTYNGKHKARRRLNKAQSLDSLCPEAQERWLSLDHLSQFEEVFRFRTGTDRRLWGVRVQHHFFLVWYERQHLICPINS